MFPLERLPDYGPLEIQDLQEYLKKSKEYVTKHFDSTKIFENNLKFEKLINIKTIGAGSFGIVMLMKHMDEDTYYAVKAISKKAVVKSRQVDHIHNEKQILSITNFPFIVHLVGFDSDNSYLYFIMPFLSGGDMFSNLRRVGKFNDTISRFYASQVVLALEYLHFLDLVYRDLKPENILMDHTGYIKLTDFGFGKRITTRTWTLCGTPEYLAPEILLNKGYSKAVDWWALGVFVFEMVSGRSPYFAKGTLKTYEKILENRYIFPADISTESKDLIKKLLQPNISQRFGCLKNGVQDIKDHVWFRPIEWLTVLNRKMDPPYVPRTDDKSNNFSNYKNITLKISSTQAFTKEFENF